MTAYTTIERLVERFGERMLNDLADRSSPPTGVLDPAVVNRAIADATAMIDGYLAARYLLPLTEVPPLVAELAQIVTIYKLHGEVVAEKIKADYADATRQLRDISQGVIRLSVAGVEPVSSGTTGVRTNDRARAFSDETLKGFV